MSKVRGASRLLIVLAIVVAGLGLAAAPASAAPALVVTPSMELAQWQIVTVTGTGFTAGESLLVTQCLGSSGTAGCLMDPNVNYNGAYAVADGSGAVSVTLRLDRFVDLPGDTPGGSCTEGDCSVVAIARQGGAERARAAIDLAATGTAPTYPQGTADISTTAAGPTSASVEITGSGFQPWFVASPLFNQQFIDGQTLSEAEAMGAGPGAWLTLCPNNGVTPGWGSCQTWVGPPINSPGNPEHLSRPFWVVPVEADGTLDPTTTELPRVWTFPSDRVDCALEDCTFYLDQFSNDPGVGETVEWAPESAPWPSDIAFIEDAYAGILGRAPGDDEVSYLREVLRERALTARGFLTGLADSSNGRRVAELARLYRAALNRRPDAAGLTYWAGQLKASGGNMSAIARAFGRTSEFRSVFGSGSNATAVTRAYQRTLGRNPFPDESAYWVGRLQSGLDRTHMIHLFSRTPEYLRREGPRSLVTAVFHGILGTVPTAAQWSYMDIDLQQMPSGVGLVTPIAWRADDVLLELLGSEALAAAVD